MKIEFNKNKIHKFKDIPKKVVLIGTLAATILTSPIVETKAYSYEETESIVSSYQLSDDEDFLYIEHMDNINFTNEIENLNELYIKNSTINETTLIFNKNVKHITLENCKFNENINFPNDIQELTIISSLPNNLNMLNNININKIVIQSCSFDDLDIIKNLYSIDSIEFKDCNIGDLKGLENLKSLNTLSFENTRIENIEELRNLNNLKNLSLIHTSVEDLTPIKDLDLYTLDISNSPIEDMSVIKNMKNLKSFFCTNCEMIYTEDIIKYIENNNIDSNISWEGLEIQKQVKNIVKNIINDNMSTKEKISAITNYVINTIEYSYNEDDIEYLNNALKYALKGEGRCRNYTALTTALLKEAGVKNYEIADADHIWNLVYVDNEFYWIDSTWIDTAGYEYAEDSVNYMTNEEAFLTRHHGTIPSSMYNKINNITLNKEIINNNIKTNNINENNIKNEAKNLSKKFAFGALVGVAAAFNGAILIKRSNKKVLKKEQTKKR